MDQWGVGRQGFDDGLVIFFDMRRKRLEHGQVQLYAGPGFEAAFLCNSERQAIFENDMLPFLRSGDFDGALGAALTKVDAAATPAHAAELERARQINAVLGLVGAPVILFGLVGWALFHWRRFGKDPVYLDDPSVLMPAPPPDLTAASGAMVMDGGTSRRALTTAMLDLAIRGLIAFREDGGGILGTSKKVGIHVDPPRGDQVEEAQRALQRPTADRPGRGGRPPQAAQTSAGARAPTSSRPRTCPSSAPRSPSSTRRSRSTSSPRLVRRGAEQGRSRAGPVVARWRSSAA